MGHQRVEERHGEGQDQQDAFPLPRAARQGSVLLLNLASRCLGEPDRLQPRALGLAVPAVEAQQGCPCLLRLRCPPASLESPAQAELQRGVGAALTTCMCSKR